MTWLAAFLAALPYADRPDGKLAADRRDKRKHQAAKDGAK